MTDDPNNAPRRKERTLSLRQVVLLLLLCTALAFAAGMGGALTALRLPAATKKKRDAAVYFPAAQEGPGQPADTPEELPTLQDGAPARWAVYDRAARSTVGVNAPFVREEKGLLRKTKQETAAAGTGFFVRADGYLVTNYHVIRENVRQNAGNITVTVCTGKTYPAEVRGVDPALDLAVLKIDESVSPAVFGASAALRVGDEVMVVGNALSSLSYTCTTGAVSFLNRTVVTAEGRYLRMIQTDAAINEGNSGGPVLNRSGETVGIAAMKYTADTAEGLGFFLPIDDVRDSIDRLIETGQAAHFGLGLEVDLTPAADPAGIAILDVPAGGAKDAGLKPGGVITAADGADVCTFADLFTALHGKKAGDTVSLTVFSGGTRAVYSVVVSALPEEEEGKTVV